MPPLTAHASKGSAISARIMRSNFMPSPRSPAKASASLSVPWPMHSTRFLVLCRNPFRSRRPPQREWTGARQGTVRGPHLSIVPRSPMTLTAPRQPVKKIRERIVAVSYDPKPFRMDGGPLGGALTTAQAHRTAAKHHPRCIGLFGGSFDPIHNGHLAVARAADRCFNFDEIHFIPASRPPHKLKQHLAPFPPRFAMVSLACAEHPHFIPSLAEAGEDFSGAQLHYSVDTVRYFRHVYHGHADRIFFIAGAYAFLDIPMLEEYETLLGRCDFIIANRPGIRSEALRLVIPPGLIARPHTKK